MNPKARQMMFKTTYNLDFDYHYIVREHLDGQQIIFRLDNGYGLSAVNCTGTHSDQLTGTYECAILKFIDDDNWKLCFNTHITEDIIPHCSANKIVELLTEINKL